MKLRRPRVTGFWPAWLTIGGGLHEIYGDDPELRDLHEPCDLRDLADASDEDADGRR